VLLYGSEAWTVKKEYMTRIQAAEMKFLQSAKGCTTIYNMRNEEIIKN
jgi:hypothetical protein